MATGDLKRSLRKLEQVLRALNYPNEVDYVGLAKGETAASLPIISYSLTSYSPYVTELLMESNIELIAKNDLRFTDTVYKLLRDQFAYKPILTKKQFIQSGFAEWKIQIVCDVLNCVMKKHKELTVLDKSTSQQRKKIVSDKPEPCLSSEKAPAEAVGIDVTGRFTTSGKTKAVVIRHLYKKEDNVDTPADTVSSATDVSEGFGESDGKISEIMIPEVNFSVIKSDSEDINDDPGTTELQTVLAECRETLRKMTWLEKRLDRLEEAMKGKVVVDEKTWTSLISRVTLLETEMILSKKNECAELNAACEDCHCISEAVIRPFDRKMSVERPACIQPSSGSSAYSTVSSDSIPRSSTITYCGLKDISEETTIQKMERMKKMFEETAELLKCSRH